MQLVKYENRKIYGKGRYWTRGEIESLVKQGESLSVKDYVTDNDITEDIVRSILATRIKQGLGKYENVLLLLRNN